MWLLFVMISTLGWALVNVLDSVLVHRYEKHPMLLQWSQSLFSLPFLLYLPLAVDVSTDWMYILLLFGVLGWAGDLWFFKVLAQIDVSVSNLGWAILSVFLSLAGFAFFQESWTSVQTVGAALILSGTVFMAVYHKDIPAKTMLVLVTTQALVYLPYYILKKAAIDVGIAPVAVFFWSLVGRETLGFATPLFYPALRRRIVKDIRFQPLAFSVLNGTVITSFLIAEYAGALAFQAGQLSLVSVVSNIQPFVVMGIAWLFLHIAPRFSPKELLSRKSVGIKLISFTLAFLGLALLATSQ